MTATDGGRNMAERYVSRADEDLLELAASGDQAAFGAFYARTVDDVLSFFYRRTACPHTSADLAAETFAKALTSVRRFKRDIGTGRSWLFGVANNLHLQWLRSGRTAERARRKLRVVTPDLTEDDIAQIERSVDWAPMQSAMRAALADLSGTLRSAVILRVVDELSYEDVAQQLGCTVGAARVRVSRGLASMSVALETLR